jgi:hypothetical protein
MSKTSENLVKKAIPKLKKFKPHSLGNDPTYKHEKHGRIVEYHKGIHDDIIQSSKKGTN